MNLVCTEFEQVSKRAGETDRDLNAVAEAAATIPPRERETGYME